MNGPAKNRLHGYEAGWLSMLLEMGLSGEQELRAAQSHVAHGRNRHDEQAFRKAAYGSTKTREAGLMLAP
jgi:hypothetical protein